MEANPAKILLIEDDPGLTERIKDMLDQAKEAAFQLVSAAEMKSGMARLGEQTFDSILLDISLPDRAGLANIKLLQDEAPRAPIIVLGEVDDELIAIEAVHEGAQDYLVKSQLNPQLLGRAIRYAIERQRAEMALLEAEEKYRGIFEHIVEGIFQTSPDGHYMSANPALARIYGYASPQELMDSITDIGRKLYVEEGRRDEFIKIMQENNVVTD